MKPVWSACCAMECLYQVCTTHRLAIIYFVIVIRSEKREKKDLQIHNNSKDSSAQVGYSSNFLPRQQRCASLNKTAMAMAAENS